MEAHTPTTVDSSEEQFPVHEGTLVHTSTCVDAGVRYIETMHDENVHNPHKYFCYIRKSQEAEERQILSPESQRDKAVDCFPDLDIEFVEEARSARYAGDRPLFADMIRRIRSGERQGIVSWHPDRLSRNPTDAGLLVQLILDGVLKDVKFASYTFMNNPEGIMMLQIALSQSQYYSAKLSQDVKRGMQKKAKMGWKGGVAPAGYLNTPERPQGTRIVVKDPERFDLVKEMWNLVISGRHTAHQVLRIVREEWGYRSPVRHKTGGTALTKGALYQMFRNPFYCGRYEYPKGSGNWYTGKHEPMVTVEEFERMQRILAAGPPKTSAKTKRFAYTGLIRCVCGYQVTAEEKRHVVCSGCRHKFSDRNRDSCPECGCAVTDMASPTVREYVYYRCTMRGRSGCQQPSIDGKELDRQVGGYLQSLDVNNAALSKATELLAKMQNRSRRTAEAVEVARARAKKVVEDRLNRLLDLKLAGQVDDEEYRTKKAELVGQRYRYGEDSVNTTRERTLRTELPERTLSFACGVHRRFLESDVDEKRNIVKTLCSNLVLKGGNLTLEARKPFRMIRGSAAVQAPESGPFEPEGTPMVEPRKRSARTKSQLLWRTVNLIRNFYETCDLSDVPPTLLDEGR